MTCPCSGGRDFSLRFGSLHTQTRQSQVELAKLSYSNPNLMSPHINCVLLGSVLGSGWEQVAGGNFFPSWTVHGAGFAGMTFAPLPRGG